MIRKLNATFLPQMKANCFKVISMFRCVERLFENFQNCLNVAHKIFRNMNLEEIFILKKWKWKKYNLILILSHFMLSYFLFHVIVVVVVIIIISISSSNTSSSIRWVFTPIFSCDFHWISQILATYFYESQYCTWIPKFCRLHWFRSSCQFLSLLHFTIVDIHTKSLVNITEDWVKISLVRSTEPSSVIMVLLVIVS